MIERKVKQNSGHNNIINLVTIILDQYTRENGYFSPDDAIIDINEIYDNVIYPEYEFGLYTDMDLGYMEDTEEKVLGKTIPKDRVILIDKSIAPESGDPRYTFTLGHEIGHGLLHADKKQLFRCSSKSISMQTDLYEKQANYFAENLLMPDKLLMHRFYQYYELTKSMVYAGNGTYWLGGHSRSREYHVDSLQDYYKVLAKPLTKYFSNISKESLGYKLSKLNIVQNRTDESFYGMPHQNSISKALFV